VGRTNKGRNPAGPGLQMIRDGLRAVLVFVGLDHDLARRSHPTSLRAPWTGGEPRRRRPLSRRTTPGVVDLDLGGTAHDGEHHRLPRVCLGGLPAAPVTVYHLDRDGGAILGDRVPLEVEGFYPPPPFAAAVPATSATMSAATATSIAIFLTFLLSFLWSSARFFSAQRICLRGEIVGAGRSRYICQAVNYPYAR
jgi:hypothetical protein